MTIVFYQRPVSSILETHGVFSFPEACVPSVDKNQITAIHLDAIGGVAGDMFAAALLDARPDLWPRCEQALAAINRQDSVSAHLERGSDKGFAGSRLNVSAPKHGGEAGHGHVHWVDIRDGVERSDLRMPVRDIAIAVFSILAEAEATVHGIEVERVGFHEVGAADSIIDIVIAAVLIDALGPCQWSIGPLPRGRGQVKSRHGFLPLPAPATTEILKGFVLVDDGEEGERVTPTGAAILKFLEPSQNPDTTPRTLLGTGMGFGIKKLESRANVLRVTLYADVSTNLMRDGIEVLRCEIDDQTGEDLAAAISHLREIDGVLDVCQWPVFGKKGRVATALQVLARPALSDKIVVEILNETQTLGVRRQPQLRNLVRRQETVIDGVRVKVAHRPDGMTAKAEIDDIAHGKSAEMRLALKQRAETRALAEAEKNAK